MSVVQFKLVVCEVCQKHAYITLPSKAMPGKMLDGPEFTSKADGFDILYRAVNGFGMDLVSSGQMREEIRRSVLPENHLQVDAHLLYAVSRWNAKKRRAASPRPDFHKFLRKIRTREIPPGFLERMDDLFEAGIHPQRPDARKLN